MNTETKQQSGIENARITSKDAEAQSSLYHLYCPKCGHTWYSPNWDTWCPKWGCTGRAKRM